MSGTPITSSLPARSGLPLCLRPPGAASQMCREHPSACHVRPCTGDQLSVHLLPAPGGVAAPPSSATSQDSMTTDDRSHPWGASAASSAGYSPPPSFDPAVLPEVAQEAPAGGQAGAQAPGGLAPFSFGGAGPALDPLGVEQPCWAASSVCRLTTAAVQHVAYHPSLAGAWTPVSSVLSWQHSSLGAPWAQPCAAQGSGAP